MYGAESSPLDLLALYFSEEALVSKFIPSLSFLVLNLHLSATLTRLTDDTSGGHTKKCLDNQGRASGRSVTWDRTSFFFFSFRPLFLLGL